MFFGERRNCLLDIAVGPDGEELIEMDANGPLVALVFKVQLFEGRRHCFVRIYRGTLKPGDQIYVPSQETDERVARVFDVDANRKSRLHLAVAGQIVLLAGLRKATTGDTLTTLISRSFTGGIPTPLLCDFVLWGSIFPSMSISYETTPTTFLGGRFIAYTSLATDIVPGDINAGCSMRVSTPPRLEAISGSWTASMKRLVASRSPSISRLTTPPYPFICWRATL